MLGAYGCRTCDKESDEGFKPLASYTKKYPEKQYADLLHELTNINVKQSMIAKTEFEENITQELPTALCSNCSMKLENAYEYVQQARQANERWHKILLASVEQISLDMPDEDMLSIKFEFLEETGLNVKTPCFEESMQCIKSAELKPVEFDGDLHADIKKFGFEEIAATSGTMDMELIDETADPITLPQTKLKSNNETTNCDTLVNGIKPDYAETTEEIDSKLTSESTETSTKKSRRRRSAANRDKPINCSICEQSFAAVDQLREHLKIHNKPKLKISKQNRSSQSTIDSLYSSYLYCSERLRSIQCKLCEKHFETILQLREHLLQHKTLDSLEKFTLQSIVAKEHYAGNEKLHDIKQQIIKDLSEEQYFKYYAIVNHYGYELSLSDSDEDAEVMESSVRFKKYYCQVCQQYFARKHEIYKHTLDKHYNDTLPNMCKFCKMGFVSERMFRQHQRTHCHNKAKKYQCLKCPGKFMFMENLSQHECVQACTAMQHRKMQCRICLKTYTRKALLQQHMQREHSQASEEQLEYLEQSEQLEKQQKQQQDKPQRQRCIKCCLCTLEFEKLSELRVHLLEHSDGKNGCDPKAGQYYINFYPALRAEMQADIAAHIAEAFTTKELSKFYSAIDESGNELDLNDSESESEAASNIATSYECELCQFVCQRRKYLLQHQLIEHSAIHTPMPYVCFTCQKGFVSSALLEQHLLHECGNMHKHINCDKCQAKFVWTDNYIRHLQLKHIVDTPTTPPISKANAATPEHLALAARLQCEICNKTFIWQNDLTRHMRTHLDESLKSKCPFCSKRFARKDNMAAHIRAHHETMVQIPRKENIRWNKSNKWQDLSDDLCKPNGCKQIQCMICNSKHSKISDLRTHLSTHQYTVPMQSRSPDAIHELNMLLYPRARNLSREQLAERIMQDIKAEQYQLFYSITNEFGYELSLNSTDTDTEDDEEECSMQSSSTTGRDYCCELCNTHFQRKYLLFRHQKTAHSWQEAPHICSYCQARFVCGTLLDHHYTTQCKNNEKRFTCRKCPLKFMWQDNLRSHMEQQHSELNENTANTNAADIASNKNRYDCKQCERSFDLLRDLTRHMVMHNSSSYHLKCHWCPRRFYRKANFLMHIKRHGIPANSFNYAESLLMLHYQKHGAKLVQCRVCPNIQFATIGMLRIHLQQESATEGMRTHHSFESMLNYSIRNERGFELALDDSDTAEEESDSNTRVGLGLTTNSSIARKLYGCEICQLTFKRKYQLGLHKQSVHKYEELPLKCLNCVFRTVCMDVLAYHMRTQCYNEEKQLTCSKCNFKYMWPENLAVHMQLQHAADEDLSSTPPESPNKGLMKKVLTEEFKCELCSCKYNRRDRLAAHLKRYHADVLPVETKPVSTTMSYATQTSFTKPNVSTTAVSMPTSKYTNGDTPKKGDKTFLCAFCGKAVTSSSNLKIHMRRHTGEKPFKCDYCDMAFPRSCDLKCHRRKHTGEKPHTCTVCQKSFSRSYKLHQHMRIHSGIKPYKCTYCEKSFAQSNDLRLHIRRHTGERPYICGTCGQRFIQGTALKNHRLQRGHFDEEETVAASEIATTEEAAESLSTIL